MSFKRGSTVYHAGLIPNTILVWFPIPHWSDSQYHIGLIPIYTLIPNTILVWFPIPHWSDSQYHIGLIPNTTWVWFPIPHWSDSHLGEQFHNHKFQWIKVQRSYQLFCVTRYEVIFIHMLGEPGNEAATIHLPWLAQVTAVHFQCGRIAAPAFSASSPQLSNYHHHYNREIHTLEI